ncbi:MULTISPECIES: OmpP1/FadL family transporter [unclassified Neisseria]|uniref:OmpP1/FadL family transporter n=1 Tax=unclassified Neisseria TaxID=2623750 RepID=UPI0010728285|nr:MULTISPECIES: OmpP1/FadL family transporter [unclassified Neisseria]MBF0803753.1 transporter [Neisseria sp. 19428wB4_WF04]TFU43577.1 transporter [Neisseria sp. WF04]
MKYTPHYLAMIVGAAFAVQAYASGYHFGTQSVSAQSTANAAAGEAADASTLFYNPAGLVKLESSEISASLNLVSPSVKYREGRAVYNGGTAVSNSSSSGKITKDLVFAPHLYGAYKVNDDVAAGLGVYVPFGSKTEYDHDSALRYNLNKTELTSVAVEPAVAFKLNENHSVAIGAVAQYSTAQLRKYADWAASMRHTVLNPDPAGVGNMDGYSEVKGKDWGFGYHLAWMWDINDRSRVGVNYRSHIKHHLAGSADWTAQGTVAQRLYAARIGKTLENGGTGYVAHEKAGLKITTPESLSVHGMYRAGRQWDLFGDVTWTRHSRFNRAELQFENAKRTVSGRPSNQTVIEPNWRDTYKVSLGAAYQISNPLQLRFGMAYDQSPVRNTNERLVTMPDNNRIWYSLGAKYDIGKNHTLNAAYSYIYIQKSDAVVQDKPSNAQVTTVDSNVSSSAGYKSHAHIVGLQYSYRF